MRSRVLVSDSLRSFGDFTQANLGSVSPSARRDLHLRDDGPVVPNAATVTVAFAGDTRMSPEQEAPPKPAGPAHPSAESDGAPGKTRRESGTGRGPTPLHLAHTALGALAGALASAAFVVYLGAPLPAALAAALVGFVIALVAGSRVGLPLMAIGLGLGSPGSASAGFPDVPEAIVEGVVVEHESLEKALARLEGPVSLFAAAKPGMGVALLTDQNTTVMIDSLSSNRDARVYSWPSYLSRYGNPSSAAVAGAAAQAAGAAWNGLWAGMGGELFDMRSCSCVPDGTPGIVAPPPPESE